jgi:hypothetical protein
VFAQVRGRDRRRPADPDTGRNPTGATV